MKRLFLYSLIFLIVNVKGQSFSKMSVRCGPALGGISSGLGRLGVASSFELSLLTFGKKKKFDFNSEFSYIQKGGLFYTTYNTTNQPEGGYGFGYEKVNLNYLSFSPSLKYNLTKYFFVKVGSRIDYLLTHRFVTNSIYAKKNFIVSKTNYGVSYSLGFLAGKKRVKFIYELQGQNDFTPSIKDKYSKGNNYTIINYFGILITLRSE